MRRTEQQLVVISVLRGELADVERGIDVLQARTNQAAGDDAAIELAANRIAAATAARRRIKEINSAMAGRTLTEMRKSSGPVAALINGKRIGGEELTALVEIETAMRALAGAGMIRSPGLELKSPGQRPEWSQHTSDAVENYRSWANFWSARRTYGDRTAEIVVRAVVHGHAFGVIERDVGIKTGRGSKIAVLGLRDYAARSGWVTRDVGERWMQEALTSFKGAPLGELGLAVARAKAVPHEHA